MTHCTINRNPLPAWRNHDLENSERLAAMAFDEDNPTHQAWVEREEAAWRRDLESADYDD